MNWITNYVRPRINSLFSRRDVPENLWTKCPECGTMLFHRELADNLNVCSNCDHHLAITPRSRFAALFDGGVFAGCFVLRRDGFAGLLVAGEQDADVVQVVQLFDVFAHRPSVNGAVLPRVARLFRRRF